MPNVIEVAESRDVVEKKTLVPLKQSITLKKLNSRALKTANTFLELEL